MASTMRLMIRAVFAVAAAAACAQTADFHHLTDTHLFRPAGFHPALASARAQLRPAERELAAFVRNVSPRPSFLLVTGDLVDGYCFDSPAGVPVCDPIEVFRGAVRGSRARLYPVLGNHDVTLYHPAPQPGGAPVKDMSQRAGARAAWRKAMPDFRNATYYSFRRKVGERGFTFVVLDNGDTGDAGFVQAQLEWLRGEVRRRERDTLVLALHVPLAADAFSKSVLEALSTHPRAVLALAGHRHSDAIEEIPLGAGRLTQVRTAIFAGGKSAARRLTLAPDRIDIYATGRAAELVQQVRLANN